MGRNMWGAVLFWMVSGGRSSREQSIFPGYGRRLQVVTARASTHIGIRHCPLRIISEYSEIWVILHVRNEELLILRVLQRQGTCTLEDIVQEKLMEHPNAGLRIHAVACKSKQVSSAAVYAGFHAIERVLDR